MYHLSGSPNDNSAGGCRVTRLSFRSLVLILALSLIVLCGATSQPPFLAGTQLLPTFRMTFTDHLKKEVRPPDPTKENEVIYLTSGNTIYFKSVFRQSPLIPGEPAVFKDKMTWWFLVRDSQHQNQYTARVFCVTCTPKSWVLVAVNFGPPRSDMVARFYASLPLPPLPEPLPASGLPVSPPPSKQTPIEWFLTAGSMVNGKPSLPAPDKQGYFAMYAKQGVTSDGVFYKQPFSLGGSGAGAWHQAYGQLVYDTYTPQPKLLPSAFTPPSGYTQIVTPELANGQQIVTSNCAICHTVENGPTTLYLPNPPTPQHH
jgi:hypothetical protein